MVGWADLAVGKLGSHKRGNTDAGWKGIKIDAIQERGVSYDVEMDKMSMCNRGIGVYLIFITIANMKFEAREEEKEKEEYRVVNIKESVEDVHHKSPKPFMDTLQKYQIEHQHIWQWSILFP